GWDDIPATTYGRHTGKFSGKSQLGLVTIETDEGVKGHAFLGSSMRGAHMDGQSLIQYLKPVVVNQDPLERERLYRAMWHKNRQTTYRAIGAMDVALWDIAGKVAGAAHLPPARLVSRERACLCQLRRPAEQGGVRGGSDALQGRRLDGLQDPPAHRSRRRCRGLSRRPARG